MSDQDKDIAQEEQLENEQPQNEQETINEVNIDYKEKWMRAQADYQNLQKETALQRSQWAQMSEIVILQEFIPVYENFKKAFHSDLKETITDTTAQNWMKGIEYIMKQFADILKQHGVEEMETVGTMFNPEMHDALSEEESDKESGIILKEVQGGYKVGDRIIQAAKVIISK